MLPHNEIELKLQSAVQIVLPDADVSPVLVRPCPDPKFGDYQSNALMSLAKARKLNPRQLATEVLVKLDVGDVCEKVEIAGAGFLNFRLKDSALVQTLEAASRGEHLFFDKVSKPRTIVVDFSSPNVAKPMHVGHIRSTILGDSLARTLKLLGHTVITDNHIGDWGTQFGMLIVGWKTLLDRTALEREPLAELERIYKIIQPKCDPVKPEYDSTTRDNARAELVKLQSGDEENLAIWREMIRLSQQQFDEIYSRLGVIFDHTLGESFYNDKVQQVYNELSAFPDPIAVVSEGALVVFQNQEGASTNIKGKAFIIRKSDGAANYASTDLATVLYRKETFKADKVLYVVDARQRDHFDHLTATVHKWFTKTRRNPPELPQVDFGMILGDNNRPLKTRSGENVKLRDLLDEAEDRAFNVVSGKNPELLESKRRDIARAVGLGAVKYQDLLPNRTSDYVFSWGKMLALQGNTAPYLQYAYARIQSIFRKSETSNTQHPTSKIQLAAPEEFALAKHLLNLGLTLQAVAEELRPNYLCNYLYELAGKFTSFYENCPVLKAADETTRHSRLALCDLTARVLKLGLETLGIETAEQM